MTKSFAFSHGLEPDWKRLVIGSQDGAKVWDFDSGRELFALAGHQGIVTGVAWSPDPSL